MKGCPCAANAGKRCLAWKAIPQKQTEPETESTVGEAVRLYRDALVHPTWEIINEGSSGDFGWFSWTVPDTEGRLWYGRLIVAPLQEGWKQVWLSLYSNDADDG